MSNLEAIKADRTVTVGCKLPGGLILRQYEMQVFNQPVMGGGVQKEKRAVQVGDEIRLRGNAVPVLAAVPRGLVIEGGYALTSGVPADFWEKWHAANKDSPLVKNRIVFAYGDTEGATSIAREQEEIKTNLEPLDMTMKSEAGREFPTDTRVPRKIVKQEK